MKWYIFPVLLLLLLATSCIGESQEVSRAKADYIQAKTRTLIAEARIKEAEAHLRELENQHTQARQAQWLELEEQSRKAAEARRATFEKILVQTIRVLAYIITAAAVVSTLTWAISSAYGVRARSRQGLLEASTKEAQAKAQAMREERLAQEAKTNALKERRNLVEAEANRLEQERLLLQLTKVSDNGSSPQPVVSVS